LRDFFPACCRQLLSQLTLEVSVQEGSQYHNSDGVKEK
jgi:hypothetical protein